MFLQVRFPHLSPEIYDIPSIEIDKDIGRVLDVRYGDFEGFARMLLLASYEEPYVCTSVEELDMAIDTDIYFQDVQADASMNMECDSTVEVSIEWMKKTDRCFSNLHDDGRVKEAAVAGWLRKDVGMALKMGTSSYFRKLGCYQWNQSADWTNKEMEEYLCIMENSPWIEVEDSIFCDGIDGRHTHQHLHMANLPRDKYAYIIDNHVDYLKVHMEKPRS